MIIGIDASRNRSGGAKAHLIGILAYLDPSLHDIQKIHVWAFRSLLMDIPDRPWLVKHSPPQLEGSLVKQLWWQAAYLAGEARRVGCDILFATDASTLCRFSPLVVLSQDLLSYEPGLMQSYPWGKARLRLEAIKIVQNLAFRRAAGVLFLTSYASRLVQQACGSLPRTSLAAHGINDEFLRIGGQLPICDNWDNQKEINCIYVSNTDMYKHQWNVVEAVRRLRDLGHAIKLTLIGGTGEAQWLLEQSIDKWDPERTFVRQWEFIRHQELPSHLAASQIFLFASSCENLPITLLEGMAAALPIACSNRGPMPEILGKGGVYFNPDDVPSIANALMQLLKNPNLRMEVATEARSIAARYTWKNCSNLTFEFIRSIYKQKIGRI
jgi:glycosyltransferase involved in cell wall biosynthesis